MLSSSKYNPCGNYTDQNHCQRGLRRKDGRKNVIHESHWQHRQQAFWWWSSTHPFEWNLVLWMGVKCCSPMKQKNHELLQMIYPQMGNENLCGNQPCLSLYIDAWFTPHPEGKHPPTSRVCMCVYSSLASTQQTCSAWLDLPGVRDSYWYSSGGHWGTQAITPL